MPIDKLIRPILWLWPPIVVMILLVIGECTLSPHTLNVIHSENGPNELLQFVLLVIALLVSCRILWTMDRGASPWLTAWIGLSAVCCFYVAGEEVCWGQVFLHWPTPAEWAAINDQDETNLHNISPWLDQKPRLLLELGTIVGGLLIPLLRHTRPQWLPQRFRIIYPPDCVAVTALLYFIVKIVQGVARHFFHVSLFTRAAEVEELYMYYFVLLYLLSMNNRLRRQSPILNL